MSIIFPPPRGFQSCGAVTLEDAPDPNLRDAPGALRKLHVNWGRASSYQVERILADAQRPDKALVDVAESVANTREICRTFDEAPQIPASGTFTASGVFEKERVDLLFLDDVISSRAMDLFPKYSPSVRVPSKNPAELRDVSASSWISVFGEPRVAPMGEVGVGK